MNCGLPNDYKFHGRVSHSEIIAMSAFDQWFNRHEIDEIWEEHGIKGEGVGIMVFDTGSSRNLVEVNWSGDYITSIKKDGLDRNGHGTWIQGAIKGKEHPAYLSKGAVPKCWLGSSKVLHDNGNGTLSSIMTAGYEALKMPNVDIWVLSIGVRGDIDDEVSGKILEIHELFKRAKEQGVIVFLAAGNANQNTINLLSTDDVIVIGAIDRHKNIASFTSDIVTENGGVDYGVKELGHALKEGEANSTGSSMSNPVAAASTALAMSIARSKGIELTVDEWFEAIRVCSEDLGEKGKDLRAGSGLVDTKKLVSYVLGEQEIVEEPIEDNTPEPCEHTSFWQDVKNWFKSIF